MRIIKQTVCVTTTCLCAGIVFISDGLAADGTVSMGAEHPAKALRRAECTTEQLRNQITPPDDAHMQTNSANASQANNTNSKAVVVREQKRKQALAAKLGCTLPVEGAVAK